MDSGYAAFPDGERLHEAFAEEVDRPGLEGPAFELVLRSGTSRLRRRRAGVGATFAVAGVAAVASATLATAGASHHVNSAAAAATTTTTTGTTVTVQGALGTTLAAPAHTSTTNPPAHPDDAVLTSGTIDGHAWKLVRQFTLNQQFSDPGAPAGTVKPQWCGNLNVIVDGVWTNAGSGDTACLDQNGKPTVSANPADPGYTTIAILDARHDRLGAVTAGSVSTQITSVTAQCGAQALTAKTSQPAGDVNAYYTFTFADGASCQVGSLSFFNASGSRTAFLPGLSLSGGK